MTADPCGERHLLLQAELDGELDAAASAALAAHLEGCAGCAALLDELGGLSTRLQGGLTRHAAPPALQKAIQARLRPPAPPGPRRMVPGRFGLVHGASFGAGLAVAAAIALVVLPRLDPARPDPAGLLPDVVAAHIRALQPGHLVDVQSTDQHTVKPWFDGRLDYAPPVRDLAAQGYPLIGGRLDYLDGRPVAALVYRRDKHLIDLFVSPGNRPGADGTVQGYNVRSWTGGGMRFRAVSDVEAAQLAEFARLMQASGG